jgi:hypothetical protein
MLAGKDTEKAISDLGSQIQEIWTRFMRGEALDNRHIEFERYFIDSRGT